MIPFLFLVFSLFFVSYSLAAQVHFQWGASSGVVDGYRIYYGFTHQGPYPNLLDHVGGAITEYTATLDEGLTYYLVVRAYNDYGESGNSNEVISGLLVALTLSLQIRPATFLRKMQRTYLRIQI